MHCAAGISRSASVVIAYLMAHGSLSLEDARSAVKASRPAINPNQVRRGRAPRSALGRRGRAGAGAVMACGVC